METHFKKSELEENPDLVETVTEESNVKFWVVDYVGNLKRPEDGNVTLQMIVDVFADEFPELLVAVAEENFVRGYEQGLDDAHNGFSFEVEKSKLNEEYDGSD